jgi:hypothetical protein
MVNVPYKRVVSNIMYCMVSTRPDIHAVVEIIAQFFNNLGLSHWQIVKQLLIYLQSIQNLALRYSPNFLEKNINIKLHGFCDSD